MAISLAQFRLAYQSSPVSTMVSRLEDGVILDVNPSFRELTGYAADEAIGCTATELALWADHQRAHIGVGLREQGAVTNIASSLRTKGQDVRITLTSLQIVELEGVRCVLRTDYDITERQRAEDAQRASEEKFRSLVDSMEDLVLVLDAGLVITAVHGSWPLTHKLDPNRMVGHTVREVFGTNEAPVHEDACRRALQGENRIYELNLVMPTGTRHLQISVSPLRSSNGHVTGLVLVGRDVTTVKRAELELRQRDERLQEMERVDSLGRLAGGVAHDFNNLLTIINGYSELLLGSGPLSPDDERKIREIAKAGERAAALTGQLLAFGRRQVLQPRVIDLNETVQEMTTMLRRLIGEDIVLTTRLDRALGKVQADPGQLGQVIMNLAVNARDAMPAGGRLFVETANIDVTEEYARWHTDLHPGPYVQLTVSDTGSGMDRATQARVFEPFFTTKEKGKGTGLGLSTAYGIVRQSGGEILLYSEPGRGTTFKIFLPRVHAAAADAAPVSTPVATDLRGHETILVAEDEAVIRMLARQVLEGHGYTVLEAEDGLQALGLIQKHQGTIDLLLTDVVMPRLGGTELVRHLRDLDIKPKVLYMSGYTGMLFEELGKSDPGSRFLQKPFQPAMLLHLVRELLGPSKTRA